MSTSINPNGFAEDHVLCLSIGDYFRTFSHVELMISVITALTMKVDIRVVQFLWRDVGLKIKTKGARRSALEAFGKDDQRYLDINAMLNKIERCSEYRNGLAHGTFIGGHGGNTIGRPGQSFQQMLSNFEPIDGKTILEESKKLHEIFLDFGRLISTNFAATPATSSEVSSRGNQ